MNKRIMFVRFINANCVTLEFDSLNEAVKYVVDNFISQKKISNTLKKKVRTRINGAIKLKNNYCNGQWIWLNKEIGVAQ